MSIDKDILEKLKEHDQVSKEEIEKSLFDGKKRKDVVGYLEDDDATEPQKRYIFVLGKQMGLESKDEIKEYYKIDSISELTFKEAKEIIDEMLIDLGENKEDLSKKQTVKEKNLKWTREAGIDHVGSKFAKCGHCKHFTGDNTLEKGECLKGNKKGKFRGTDVHPMLKDCFSFKHGKLQEVEEVKEYKEDEESPF